jgi:hypothetical protein
MTFRGKLRPKTVSVISIFGKGTAFKENGEICKKKFKKSFWNTTKEKLEYLLLFNYPNT